jgi:hypothetical protein
MAKPEVQAHTGRNIPIPKGRDHFKMIRQLTARVERTTATHLIIHAGARARIGTYLAALYEIGTCNRKCFGDAHILESLCGRSYNLGCSAYLLIERGFYDEALNLVRSLGEIANLVILSMAPGNMIQQWIKADRKTRIREFGPAKVREKLKKAGLQDVMVGEDWYQEYCEKFTHPTPQTNPNMHNDLNRGVVGAVFQEDGLTRGLNELAGVLGAIAIIACKTCKFDDLSEDIKRAIDFDKELREGSADVPET